MHELSIALSIIEVAEIEATKAKAKAISEIELEVGTLCGVDITCLETSLVAASANTSASKSKITINLIEPKARCSLCSKEFEATGFSTQCPYCSSFSTEIIKGKELRVKSIVVE